MRREDNSELEKQALRDFDFTRAITIGVPLMIGLYAAITSEYGSIGEAFNQLIEYLRNEAELASKFPYHALY